MAGPTSALEWTDASDPTRKWEITTDYESDSSGNPTPNHRLEIRHTGVASQRVLSGADLGVWSEEKKHSADARGRLPRPVYETDASGAETKTQATDPNTGAPLWTYTIVARDDDADGRHDHSWGEGAVYYDALQPAVILDDEEIRLMSNVYVDGTLIINEGTQASFLDEAHFSKVVHAQQALRVSGTLYARGELRAEAGLTAQGGEIKLQGSSGAVVLESVGGPSLTLLQSGSGGGAEGSAVVAGGPLEIDGTSSLVLKGQNLKSDYSLTGADFSALPTGRVYVDTNGFLKVKLPSD